MQSFYNTITLNQRQQLLQHIRLLQEWNKRLNITAVKDSEMWLKHVVDSLSVVPFFSSAKNVADIGTGGGFPGLVLAITYPQSHYTLIESNHKKCGFLHHVVHTLGLLNVEVVHSRIEDFSYPIGFEAIVCRALSTPQKVYNLSFHLLSGNGKIFVMAAKNYHQNWQDSEVLAPKDEWVVHPLPSIAKLGKRYLLEHAPHQ